MVADVMTNVRKIIGSHYAPCVPSRVVSRHPHLDANDKPSGEWFNENSCSEEAAGIAYWLDRMDKSSTVFSAQCADERTSFAPSLLSGQFPVHSGHSVFDFSSIPAAE